MWFKILLRNDEHNFRKLIEVKQLEQNSQIILQRQK
jgi:hypothetical protein